MAFQTGKTIEWNRSTPNDGLLLEAEYNRLYENFREFLQRGNLIVNNDIESSSSIQLTNAYTGSSATDGFKLIIDAAGNAIINQLENKNLLIRTNNNTHLTIDNNGIVTFNSIPVLPSSNPASDNQAARKAYVDSVDSNRKIYVDNQIANHDSQHDDRYYQKSEVDSFIANHDTQHDDRYYTETEVNNLISGHDTQHDDRFVQISASQSIGGVKTFSSIPELPANNPTTDNQAARKAYVDQQIARNGVLTGSIIAWLPGFFTNGGNGGFTAASLSLPDWWKECNGAALYDLESPIFNAGGRYLPNLTDARFLMGSTSANRGGAGGANTIASHTGSTYADHTHTAGNTTVSISDHAISLSHSVTQYPTYKVPSHNHMWYNAFGSGTNDQTFNSSGNPQEITVNLNNAGIYGILDVWTAGAFYGLGDSYTNTWSGTCTMEGSLQLSNHSATYSHSVAVHTHTISSAGIGSVTIANDHAENSNLPQYLSVSYIMKIK